MGVDLEDAPAREDPREIEVENFHAIQEALVSVWVGYTRHGSAAGMIKKTYKVTSSLGEGVRGFSKG